ncbi:MAG TPA: sugar phosphate isomerase/epimerase family protein [Nevskiaceae bacterium]|nr:sugar phosphate isomerase/epimerase family protein [Nevskiaceae bacterium]
MTWPLTRLPHRLAGHLGLRAPDLPLLRHLAGSGDPAIQVQRLAHYGFAGVQDNFLACRPLDEQERIASVTRGCDLQLGTFVHDALHWNQPTWNAITAAARDALMQAVAGTVECAQRTGATRAICVAGLDPARPRHDQLATMADNLALAAELAHGAHLTFCVEATAAARLPGMLVESLDDALWVTERAAHPQVAIMFDVGHVATDGDDVPAALRRARGRIGGIQIADVPNGRPERLDPGAGTLDWRAIFATIDAIGYTDLIDVEIEAMDDSVDGERRLLARLQQLPA